MGKTIVVLESWLGAVPVVPVIVRLNGFGVGVAVQLTVNVVPETLAVQPVGAALVENETGPVKPLMPVNDSADVLGVPIVTLREDGLAETEKSRIVTLTLVLLDRVPLVPVTGTLNGVTPVAQVTDRTAPEKEPLQPVGKVKPELIVKVTAPVNPLIPVTDTVEVPATVARVVIGGPAIEKSWTVTLTVVLLDKPPLVPVTGTVNGATPVEHVTDKTAPANEPLQPVGNVKPELIANVTAPPNPLIEVTATVDVPGTVARVVIGGPAIEKSCTVTETVVDLDKPPLEPVTGTVNGATPVEQVTDNTAPVNEPLQPVGKRKPELTAHVTVPENPLIPVAAHVELPATVARVVIPGQDGVKSWTVAVKLVLLESVAGAVPVVPVTGTVNGAGAVGQTTETVAPELVTVQPGGGVKPELRANATVPVKPLIAVTVQVVDPMTVARVVTGAQLMLKSTTWKVTAGVDVCDKVPLVPFTVAA